MGEERSLDTSSIFAIYTLTGNERMLQHLIQTILPDIDAASMFIPQKVVYKRVQGKRRKEVRDLFPSYLFLRCSDPEQIFFELKSVPKLSNLLHDGDYNFVPLNEQEKNFMDMLCSLSLKELRQDKDEPARLILPASLVSIVKRKDLQPGDISIARGNPDEALKVISGPLLKLAPYVTRIDYNNRKAILDVDVFGVHNIHVGIRMMEKGL